MSSIQFSSYQILSALDRIGIKRDGSQPNSKGWLSVLCPNPSHHDHSFGNCSINLNSGFIKCYSCGYGDKGNAKSIIDIVKDNMGFDFKQAKQFIEEGLYASPIQSKIETEKPKKKRERKQFVTLDLDPDKYYYTRQRKFSHFFVKEFNVKIGASGWFNDYMIIPIEDSAKGIHEFEARKVREYEVLCDFYEVEDVPFEKLKRNFNDLCSHNKIRLNKKTYQVMIDMEVMNPQDERIKYLLKPKTLYAPDSRCQETLWNIDNLNRKEPLYVVEGLGSVPSIWYNTVGNVTAIFGVSITEEQVKYLNQFETIIHIPDYDEAGYKSVEFLRYKLTNQYLICDTHYEDTDDKFIDDLKSRKLITPEEYVKKYLFQFKIKK